MTTNGNGANAQRHRILLCEPFRRLIGPGDESPVLLDVDGQLIRRRITWTHLRLTCNDDNISPVSIAIQIESHAGVLRDMHQTFRIGAAIHENARCSLIPPKPDRRGLWR